MDKKLKIKLLIIAVLAMVSISITVFAFSNIGIDTNMGYISFDSYYDEDENGFVVEGYFIPHENIEKLEIEIDYLDGNNNKVATSYRYIGRVSEGQRIDVKELMIKRKDIKGIAIPRIIFN